MESSIHPTICGAKPFLASMVTWQAVYSKSYRFRLYILCTSNSRLLPLPGQVCIARFVSKGPTIFFSNNDYWPQHSLSCQDSVYVILVLESRAILSTEAKCFWYCNTDPLSTFYGGDNFSNRCFDERVFSTSSHKSHFHTLSKPFSRQ